MKAKFQSMLLTGYLFFILIFRMFLLCAIGWGMSDALFLDNYDRGTAIMVASYIILDIVYGGEKP